MSKLQEQSFSTLRDTSSDRSFAFVRLPGDKQVLSFGEGRIDGCSLLFDGFMASTWNSVPAAGMQVSVESTPEDVYLRQIETIVASLRKRGGKTVICRQICGTFRHFDPEKMAKEYFSLFPDMFCFFFYHPQTGYWMGASPELLLRTDSHGIGHTRALAGTRRKGDKEPWSAKNIAEHQIVVEDICRRIGNTNKGYQALAHSTGTLSYGTVEHMSTDIDVVRYGCPVSLPAIISAIHPTAAVCGFPKDAALEEIGATELFQRLFYGGTLVTPGTAYVALRCVHFDSSRWCVYTGSGITPDSEPAAEWDETKAKAEPLINILKRY